MPGRGTRRLGDEIVWGESLSVKLIVFIITIDIIDRLYYNRHSTSLLSELGA